MIYGLKWALREYIRLYKDYVWVMLGLKLGFTWDNMVPNPVIQPGPQERWRGIRESKA